MSSSVVPENGIGDIAAYCCPLPDGGTVYFSLDVVERLERAVMDAFRATSRRGTEIGGLLFGKRGHGAVSIDDFQAVDCSYEKGPLYVLSEDDSGALAAVAGQHSSELVGVFRSNTRRDLSLCEEDLLLASQLLDAGSLILLIKPFASKASQAACHCWDGRAVTGSASLPFRTSELLKPQYARSTMPAWAQAQESASPLVGSKHEEPTPPQPQVEPTPLEPQRETALPQPQLETAPLESQLETAALEPQLETAQEPQVQTAPSKPKVEPSLEPAPELELEPLHRIPAQRTGIPLEPESKSSPVIGAELFSPMLQRPQRRIRIWGFAAVGVMVLLGGTLYFRPRSDLPPSVSWQNHSSSLGLLVERLSGQLLLTWNRDSSPVRNATRAVLSIWDGKQFDKLELEMNQFRSGSIVYSPVTGDVTFRLEVFGKNEGEQFSEQVRAVSGKPSPMPEPMAEPLAEPSVALEPSGDEQVPIPVEPSLNEGEATLENAGPPRAPERVFSLRTRVGAPAVAPLPEPPTVEATIADAPKALGLKEAAPPPAFAEAKPPVPAAVPLVSSAAVPARLLRRTEPLYPQLARQARVQGTVRVRATVGRDGRVSSVQALSGHPLLQQAAELAVMRWTYAPAILNGEPVESTATVDILFAMNGQ